MALMYGTLSLFSKLRHLHAGVPVHLVGRYLHSIYAKKLIMCDFGDPLQVLKFAEERLKPPSSHEVAIQILAAPINPADINTIQGTYPNKPTLPATPGNEGVGRVVAVGSNVTSLKLNDLVIPFENSLGTWRTHGIWDAKLWYKVPSNVPLVEAATMSVNPFTAYRLLKDFVPLKSGDTVIQNGANSSCGQSVIQLCRAWGINTVNIVRDRPAIESLKETLLELGATYVLTEEELRSTTMFKQGGLRAPKLALNCVGGQSSLEIIRTLGHCGVMVTYGGMSRQPVIIPTSALIFKDVRAVGFWMTRWQEKYRNSPEGKQMFEDIMNIVIQGNLKSPTYRLVPFKKYEEGIHVASNPRGFSGVKIILVFCDDLPSN